AVDGAEHITGLEAGIARRDDDDTPIDLLEVEGQLRGRRGARTPDRRVTVGERRAQRSQCREMIVSGSVGERLGEHDIELAVPVTVDVIPVRPEVLEHVPDDDHVAGAGDRIEATAGRGSRQRQAPAGEPRIITDRVTIADVEHEGHTRAEPASEIDVYRLA